MPGTNRGASFLGARGGDGNSGGRRLEGWALLVVSQR